MNAAGLDEAPDWVRRTTRAVAATSVLGWIGLAIAGASYKGEMPDPVFFGLVMLPVAAFLVFAAAVGIRAERVLKPFEALVVPSGEMPGEKTERMERGELVGAGSSR
jgi:peptidoglycan/LPS O-acetylase OafA/YrhL